MAYQPTILNGETVFRNEVFQTGLMSQLLDGIYDGEMTIGELLSHGNFGVGTFNGLDGEMVVLDGVCYQVRHDGSVSLPDLRQQTPYAVVTNFVPMIKRELPHNLLRKSASQILDDFTVSKNYMYAIKIYGEFEWVRTRTVIQGISVPGCHAHFIDDERVQGGHVVDFKLRSAKVEICPGTGLQLHLPLTPEFSSANLSPEDLAEQISKAEKH